MLRHFDELGVRRAKLLALFARKKPYGKFRMPSVMRWGLTRHYSIMISNF